MQPTFRLPGRHLTKTEILSGPIRSKFVGTGVRAWISHEADPRLEERMREEVHHLLVTHPPNHPILRELLDENQPMPDEQTHTWWIGERKELEGEMLHKTLALRSESTSTQPDLAVKIVDEMWPQSMVTGPARILSQLYASNVPCVKLLGYVVKERPVTPSIKAARRNTEIKLEYPARGQFFVQWEKNAVPLNHNTVRPFYRAAEKREDLIRQLANLFAYFHGRHNPYAAEADKRHLPNAEGDILINDCKLENFLFIHNHGDAVGTVKVLDPELWELRKRSKGNEEEKMHDIETLLNSAYKDGLVQGKADVEVFVRQYLGLHHKKINANKAVQAEAWNLTDRVMKYLEAETPK